jgi:small GTP-binding protein
MKFQGVDKKSKLIKIGKIFYNLQIWDTAGQEVYQSITKTFYKKSDALFLLFDVTDENSFLKVEKWMKEIENNANKDTAVYLVGNKIDCIDHRIVEREKAENIAKSFGKKYFEISAKLGINLKEAVFSIVKDILKKKDFNSMDPIHIVSGDRDDTRDDAGSSCCAKSNNNGYKKKR